MVKYPAPAFRDRRVRPVAGGTPGAAVSARRHPGYTTLLDEKKRAKHCRYPYSANPNWRKCLSNAKATLVPVRSITAKVVASV